jgi:hypothetical protein
MKISTNREALKLVSAFNIDAQLAFQNGSQIFNYNGDVNDSYSHACDSLKELYDDIIKQVTLLRDHLPK